jgi:predicted glycosyltransferase
MTRVLFDISHPAHVHLFKHAIKELEDSSEVVVASRRKDITVELLDAYDIKHTPISAKGESKLSLLSEWIQREVKLIKIAHSFDPDVIMSVLNPPATHASVVAGCTSVVFDDSEKSQFAAKITHPFADQIYTPQNFSRDLGTKQQRYNGFHELAYLHPDRFTPQPEQLRKHGVDLEEKYSVVRFVSWGAHHDVNQSGISRDGKRKLIETLSEEGEVYMTSERELPAEFEGYRLPIPPELVHQLLYHANLYIGDSQTMATEAAVLGTPTVRSNSFAGDGDMSNFVRLEEEYNLMRSIADEQEAIRLVERWLGKQNLSETWRERRERLIEDMTDVTDLILEVVEQVTDE